MSCWVGIPERRDWWPVTTPVMHREPHFFFNKYMSCHRFDEILASLKYKNGEVNYEDGLFHMRQMLEAWKKNMADKFNPYWINVINESIMEWYNKFAPGFMCVGCKQYPFGNEIHTICCRLT